MVIPDSEAGNRRDLEAPDISGGYVFHLLIFNCAQANSRSSVVHRREKEERELSAQPA